MLTSRLACGTVKAGLQEWTPTRRSVISGGGIDRLYCLIKRNKKFCVILCQTVCIYLVICF